MFTSSCSIIFIKELMKIHIIRLICLSLSFFSVICWPSGMVPQSTLVVIEEKDGEGSIDIKNTDKYPNLLVTKIENIEEDGEDLITVFPPVVRVEGKDTQTVRFLLTAEHPLKTERLKRVTFEGIPPKNAELNKEINVTFKQNLPVIIRPAGLAKNNTPWEGLEWSVNSTEIVISNTTPYVVRFISPEAELLPSGEIVKIPKSYILPGQSFRLGSPNGKNKVLEEKIRFYPATPWGFSAGKSYEAVLKK